VRILIVKTSSLGDVVHTLPALTDAMRARPGLCFDWVVEEGFAEIPRWHPAVDRVIPVAIRRWRKQLWQTLRSGEWSRFKQELRAARYDLVIDAQGLLKSAWLTRQVDAPSAGYDRHSIREPLAALAYRQRFAVSRELHAVERIRELVALALDYPKPATTGDYGLSRAQFAGDSQVRAAPQRRVMFLHGTTWPTKLWPEPYWQALCKQVVDAGFAVTLPWGNAEERARAERIAAASAGAQVLPRLNLRGLAGELATSAAVVAVDTGLGHLAAALSIPSVSLYGPTRPVLVGAYGANQIHLSTSGLPPASDDRIVPPEMAPLTPALVWQALSGELARFTLA
jgi:heptosyltransferase-1